MRTGAGPEPTSRANASPATERLREGWVRARRWVGDRGRGGRLGLLALLGLAVAGGGSLTYLVATPARDRVVWLYDGKAFAPDAALQIQQALAAEKVEFRDDGSHRVGVAAERWAAAMEAIAKHKAGPASLAALEQGGEAPGLFSFESPDQRAERERHQQEQKLKAIIEGYEGVRSASVTLARVPQRGGLRPVAGVTGLVVLGTERRPPSRTIQSIRDLLPAMVGGLAPDAVTVMGLDGATYVKAGDSSAASTTHTLARAEELQYKLLENLAPSIPGVDAVVRVDTPTAHVAAIAPAVVRVDEPPPPPEEARANTPIDLAAAPVEPASTPPAPAPAPAAIAESPEAKANVWVKVPRSYYLRAFRSNTPGRAPAPEDLIPYQQKTEEFVRSAWAILVPPAERGTMAISVVIDNLGESESAGLAGVDVGGEPRRSYPAWVPPVAVGAGVGLGVAIVLGTGVGMMAARRPAARPSKSRSTIRPGVVVDPPTGAVPGPSERVRDLVRRDPGAAAGVLHRWIGRAEGSSHA